jgi:predicted nucleic acid-binding protein
MTFVCNAGPLIALAKIDRLSLLRDLASSVLIPETVFHEVLAKPGPDSSRILTAAQSRPRYRAKAGTLKVFHSSLPRH